MSSPTSTAVEVVKRFIVSEAQNATVSRIDLARRVGFEPLGWQVEALESEADRMLFNCTRQGGKSTVSAILALYNALYSPGSATLIIAEGERQSKNLLKTIRARYSMLRIGERPIYESRTELQLPSGSFITALPGTSGASRSFAEVSLLILDECARIPTEAIDAASPTQSTAVNPRLIALSTPFGRRGSFWEWWDSGGDEWERYEAHWDQCSWISPEFVAHERARMSEAQFRQEYECSFEDVEQSAFSYSDIEAAFQHDYKGWDIPGALTDVKEEAGKWNL